MQQQRRELVAAYGMLVHSTLWYAIPLSPPLGDLLELRYVYVAQIPETLAFSRVHVPTCGVLTYRKP